jgi:hypothetical protein
MAGHDVDQVKIVKDQLGDTFVVSNSRLDTLTHPLKLAVHISKAEVWILSDGNVIRRV